MSDKVLLIFHDNWADEMDVDGFKIMDKQEWLKYKKGLKFTYWECCVGTNESLTYSAPKDYLSRIKVKKITPEEAVTLKKFLPAIETYGFGHFPMYENEDDENYDDEDFDGEEE